MDIPPFVAEALGAEKVGYAGLLQAFGNGPGPGQRIGFGVADDDAESVGGDVAELDFVAMARQGHHLKRQIGHCRLNIGQGPIDPAAQADGLYDHGGFILAATPAYIGLFQA